jgi:hypothetical protein
MQGQGKGKEAAPSVGSEDIASSSLQGLKPKTLAKRSSQICTRKSIVARAELEHLRHLQPVAGSLCSA